MAAAEGLDLEDSRLHWAGALLDSLRLLSGSTLSQFEAAQRVLSDQRHSAAAEYGQNVKQRMTEFRSIAELLATGMRDLKTATSDEDKAPHLGPSSFRKGCQAQTATEAQAACVPPRGKRGGCGRQRVKRQTSKRRSPDDTVERSAARPSPKLTGHVFPQVLELRETPEGRKSCPGASSLEKLGLAEIGRLQGQVNSLLATIDRFEQERDISLQKAEDGQARSNFRLEGLKNHWTSLQHERRQLQLEQQELEKGRRQLRDMQAAFQRKTHAQSQPTLNETESAGNQMSSEEALPYPPTPTELSPDDTYLLMEAEMSILSSLQSLDVSSAVDVALLDSRQTPTALVVDYPSPISDHSVIFCPETERPSSWMGNPLLSMTISSSKESLELDTKAIDLFLSTTPLLPLNEGWPVSAHLRDQSRCASPSEAQVPVAMETLLSGAHPRASGHRYSQLGESPSEGLSQPATHGRVDQPLGSSRVDMLPLTPGRMELQSPQPDITPEFFQEPRVQQRVENSMDRSNCLLGSVVGSVVSHDSVYIDGVAKVPAARARLSQQSCASSRESRKSLRQSRPALQPKVNVQQPATPAGVRAIMRDLADEMKVFSKRKLSRSHAERRAYNKENAMKFK